MTQVIALVNPPSSTSRTPEENLGLEYLAAHSRENGHKVFIIDSWMEEMSVQKTIKKIISLHPTVVGLSPSMDSFENTFKICDGLRKKTYKGAVVLGGIYASFRAKDIVDKLFSIDGIITGEADISFQKYLESLSMKGIVGAVYKEKGKIIVEKQGMNLSNLDLLPLPVRDSMPLVKRWLTPSHVMGSRGCYGNCSFCSVACFQQFSSSKKWRGRSPENIVRELVYLNKKGETMIKFIDDNFFGYGDKSREKKIANLIINSRINIRFRLSLRVNDVEDETIKLLKRAGLFAVSLGVESFVQRKLNDYAKGTTVDQNYKAINILRKNNILVQMGFIMFDPFITIEEIEEELNGLQKTRWAITKGISTRLFAADGTPITHTIEERVGFVGREGTNNLYEIIDMKARLFAKALSYWTKKNNRLYEKTIDPISAPKNIPFSKMKVLHSYCQQLKDMDIEISRCLISIIKMGGKYPELASCVDTYYKKKYRCIVNIKHSVDKLYSKVGLVFCSGENKRI